MSFSKPFVSCLVLTMLTSCIGCSLDTFLGEALIGSGVPTVEDREVDEFKGISVSGALQVNALVGEDQMLQISGDDNIVPLIKSEVRDGTLHLSLDHQGRLQTKEPLKITIAAASISGVFMSGACNATVGGVQADRFVAELSGACTLNVTGESKQLRAELSGASTMTANGLACEDVEVNVSGACKAMVHASQSIEGHASGASTVRYSGEPAKTGISVSGASSATAS